MREIDIRRGNYRGSFHPMLIIDNETVSQLLAMQDCIRVQEAAFRKIPSGGAMHRPRIDMYFPCEREDGYFRWGSMEGANDGYFAIRMKSDVVTWPKGADGNWTEEKYCCRAWRRQPGIHGSGSRGRQAGFCIP